MYLQRILILAGTALLLALSSCGRRSVSGAGAETTVRRDLAGDINSVLIKAPLQATIHVVPDAVPSITISGYANIVEHYRTRGEGNTLTVSIKPSSYITTDKEVVADITVPTLSSLRIEGQSDAKIEGVVSGNSLKLAISGAGDVSVGKVVVTQLEAKISGAGNVNFSTGTVGSATYQISGAGSMSAFDVQAKQVKAKVSGTGDIDVFASELLDAKVSGAGTIRYKGGATIKSETSGIGTVESAN